MLKIKKNKISLKNKPVLISEVSGNHNGKLDLAIKLVRKAAKYGSDLIKLQTYEANNLTLNSNKSEFYIKDKKSLWKKNNLFNRIDPRTLTVLFKIKFESNKKHLTVIKSFFYF